MKKHTLTSKLNRGFILLILSSLLVVSFVVYIEVGRMIHYNAQELTRLYSKEILSEINQRIDKEIALSVKMAKDPSVVEWLMNDVDPNLRETAYEEIEIYRSLLVDKIAFFASEHTHNYYLREPGSREEGLVPIGIMDETLSEDTWYFNTLRMDRTFDLNIDVDRFINTMRVWINVKVLNDQGEAIGVVGTGLHLEPFLEDIFNRQQGKGTKSLIIDEFGAIQLDSNIFNIRENSYTVPETEDQTIFALFEEQELKDTIKNYLNSERELTLIELDSDRYDIIALSPIKNSRWNVVTFFNSKTIYGEQIYDRLFFVGLILLVLSYAIFRKIEKKAIDEPLGDLIRSLKDVKGHDDSLEWGDASKSVNVILKEALLDFKEVLDAEYVSVNEQLDEKAQTLDQMHAKTQRLETRNKRIIDDAPFGVFMLNSDQEVIYVNQTLLKRFEIDNAEQFGILFKNTPRTLLGTDETYAFIVNEIRQKNRIEKQRIILKTLKDNELECILTIKRTTEEDGVVIYEGILEYL